MVFASLAKFFVVSAAPVSLVLAFHFFSAIVFLSGGQRAFQSFRSGIMVKLNGAGYAAISALSMVIAVVYLAKGAGNGTDVGMIFKFSGGVLALASLALAAKAAMVARR